MESGQTNRKICLMYPLFILFAHQILVSGCSIRGRREYKFLLSVKNSIAKKQTLLAKRLLLALSLACLTLPAKAELLGRISDETEQPTADKIVSPANNQHRITYRVIYSPEGEALPDCEKPPLEDSVDSHTAKVQAQDTLFKTDEKTDTSIASDSALETDNIQKTSSTSHHKTHKHSSKKSGKQRKHNRKNRH